MFFAILGIIRNITGVLSSVIKLATPDVKDCYGQVILSMPHNALIVSIIAKTLIVISLILTLNKKRLGIYGFTITIIMFSIISLVFYEDRLKQLPFNIGVALAHYALFFGLLMIKCNGIRSWYLFFPKVEKASLDQRNEGDDKPIDSAPSHVENAKVNETEIRQQNVEVSSNISAPPTEVLSDVESKAGSETAIKEDQNESVKPKNPIALKNFLTVAVVIIAIFGLVLCVHFVHRYNQPEYQYAKADSLFKKGEVDEAIIIYTRLANEKKYVKAQTRLGILYVDNDSVKPNYKLGIKYLTKASIADTLALTYLMKIYVPRSELCGGKFVNCKKLEKLSNESIKKGRLLGLSYYYLGGIAAEREDYLLAFYNWEKAASLGERTGYDNLGWLYYNGYGVKEDNLKAKEYFEKALNIDSEDDYALFFLGEIYRYGYGVDVDIAKAYGMLVKSANLGNDEAKKEVADMKMNESVVKLMEL